MICYPAIDLIDGKCVRLQQGDFDRMRTYDADPVAVARRYAETGARFIHVVDLDGARAGEPRQADLIGAIAREAGRELGCRVQSGGGIRTVAHAVGLIEKGVARVVLGSLAIKDRATTVEILKAVGPEHFTLALDVRIDEDGEPFVATEGWKRSESVGLWATLEQYRELGLRHVLCTDIGRDGMLGGPNLELYTDLRRRFPGIELQASGGVGSLLDLTRLREAAIPGVIIGRALYEKRFTLEEALGC